MIQFSSIYNQVKIYQRKYFKTLLLRLTVRCDRQLSEQVWGAFPTADLFFLMRAVGRSVVSKTAIYGLYFARIPGWLELMNVLAAC